MNICNQIKKKNKKFQTISQNNINKPVIINMTD